MELNIHEIEQTEWERKMNDTHNEAWHNSDRHVELMDILMDIRDALQRPCPHCNGGGDNVRTDEPQAR